MLYSYLLETRDGILDGEGSSSQQAHIGSSHIWAGLDTSGHSEHGLLFTLYSRNSCWSIHKRGETILPNRIVLINLEMTKVINEKHLQTILTESKNDKCEVLQRPWHVVF
jgi:hypothetical protein